jgi:hypothetical protein
MAQYAKIENNQVTNIIVADQNFINSGAVGNPAKWIEVQNVDGVNIHYVGIGFTYDAVANAFTSPKPFDSWILVDTAWVAPVDMPQGNDHYIWDELTVSWVKSPVVLPGA